MRYLLLLFSCCFFILGTPLFSNEEFVDCQESPCCNTGWPIAVDLSLALDHFRSLPEGSWEGNFGGFTSLNISTSIYETLQGQIAGSYGLYDWAGRSSAPFKNPKTLQQQAFLTAAISRETPCPSGINFGIAYDWMLNKNFGVFAVDPNLSQVRGQVGYLFDSCNEFGVWGTVDTHTAHEETQEIPLKFRAVSQVNLFWCHYFKNCAYTMIWAGTPYKRGLMYRSGRAGQFIVGARFSVPLTEALSINGHAAYMAARRAPDGIESKNYASCICLSLTYSFGCKQAALSPYMSLADNSNFLVDTNLNK